MMNTSKYKTSWFSVKYIINVAVIVMHIKTELLEDLFP